MAKAKSTFICSSCGATHSGWSGRCGACGAWNTIEQQLDVSNSSKAKQALSSGRILETVAIDKESSQPKNRLTVGVKEIDEVLGGGVVRGSVVLIAGQPGIGKSTLLLQLSL